MPSARSGYRYEKRIGYCQECDCSNEWAYFNKMNFTAGRMINCGREGCYFETDQPVLPGSTVLIRIVPGSSGPKRRLPDCQTVCVQTLWQRSNCAAKKANGM